MSVEVLGRYQSWARGLALSYARSRGDPGLVDDYAQEALIAIWQALEREPDAPPVHLKMVARKRLNNCYSRDVWIGQERRGHGAAVTAVPTADDSPRFQEMSTLAHFPADPSIRAAVAGLSPRKREYVYLRFWLDWDTKQLRKHFGYAPFALWGHPREGARVQLKERLAQLVTT